MKSGQLTIHQFVEKIETGLKSIFVDCESLFGIDNSNSSSNCNTSNSLDRNNYPVLIRQSLDLHLVGLVSHLKCWCTAISALPLPSAPASASATGTGRFNGSLIHVVRNFSTDRVHLNFSCNTFSLTGSDSILSASFISSVFVKTLLGCPTSFAALSLLKVSRFYLL